MSSTDVLGLPAELLAAVLEQLPQDELRNASQVSRSFYRGAHDAGLSLHRMVHSNLPRTLTTFIAVVEHAVSQPHLFRLELTLVICSRQVTVNGEVPFPLAEVFQAVRRAIPLLVCLRLNVDPVVAVATYSALVVPAPQLHTFSLAVFAYGPTPSDGPAALFGGQAPRLRTVELDMFVLLPTWAAAPAWSRVRKLTIYVHAWELQLAIAHFFPGLRTIDIKVKCRHSPQPQMPCIDISGAVLDTLTIRNDDKVPLQLSSGPTAPRPRICTIAKLCTAVRLDESLWPETGGALNAHLQLFYTLGGVGMQMPPVVYVKILLCDYPGPRVLTGAVVSISGAHAQWRNTQYAEPAMPGTGAEAHALSMLPHIRMRLISLTIDEALLALLLQISYVLDSLRELWVDFTPVRHASVCELPEEIALSCPSLACVTAFSTDTATLVGVPHESIRALGRLRGARAHLELVLAHVAVIDKEKEMKGLSNMFTSVRVVDDADRCCVPRYYHHREDNPRLATWVV